MMVSIIGNFSSAETPLVGSSSSSSFGRAGQRHRDVEQLAHAAGQLGHAALAVLGQAEALQQRLGALASRRRGAPAARSSGRASWQAPATSMLSSTVRSPTQLRDLERARHAEPGRSRAGAAR